LAIKNSSEDRRFFSLSLSDKGTTIYNSLEFTTNQFYKRILNQMEQDDQDALIQGLKSLLKALEISGC